MTPEEMLEFAERYERLLVHGQGDGHTATLTTLFALAAEICGRLDALAAKLGKEENK